VQYSRFIELEVQLGMALKVITTTGTPAAPQEVEAFWAPVFDRTSSDCVYGNSKGSLTFQVLNRLEANMSYLNYTFAQAGYRLPVNLHEPDWTRTTYIRYGELERIRQNYLALKNVIASQLSPRELKAFEGIGFVDINILEQLANDAFTSLDRLQSVYLRSAQVLCYAGFNVYLPMQPTYLYDSNGVLLEDSKGRILIEGGN
jgi:hypothetical protein